MKKVFKHLAMLLVGSVAGSKDHLQERIQV
jgi:hypothetical protein